MITETCRGCVDYNAKCDGRWLCAQYESLEALHSARATRFKLRGRHLSRRIFLSTPPSSYSSERSHFDLAYTRDSSRDISDRESVPLTIDEQRLPSLAARSIAAQQIQVYADFIACCFPCLFRCTEGRVPVTCVEFVESTKSRSQKCSPASACFDWALRTLTTTFIGLVHDDHRLLEAGILSYGRALRALTITLSDISSVKSDEVLATSIGLAIFEKYACSRPDSWIQHAAGVKSLMKLRGPDAQLHGYGQAMYIAYRNFFITAALLEGKECFLEEPEWQALGERLAAHNAKQPDSSIYTDIIERGFHEMVKVPGHVKRVREMMDLPRKKQAVIRPGLLQGILASRATLRGIHTELGVSISMIRADHKCGGFTGPVPYSFVDSFSMRAMSGIRSGIILLNHLLSLLDPAQSPAIELESHALGAWRLKPRRNSAASAATTLGSKRVHTNRLRLLIESTTTTGKKESMTTDWMDRVMTTMGMDGVRITLLDE